VFSEHPVKDEGESGGLISIYRRKDGINDISIAAGHNDFASGISDIGRADENGKSGIRNVDDIE